MQKCFTTGGGPAAGFLQRFAMSLDALTLTLSIVPYIVVMSVTPGPNNLMLLSSGVRFGAQRSLPHMLGISVGGAVMIVLTGLGLLELFQRHPLLQQGVQWGGMAYLLWLAWQMTRAPAPQEALEQEALVPGGAAQQPPGHAQGASSAEALARPLGFLGAAAFQWVNPKMWMMALGLLSAYLPPGQGVAAVALVALVFGVTNLPCISVWAIAGQHLRHWLQQPARLQAFNWSMAAALLLSMAPVLLRQ